MRGRSGRTALLAGLLFAQPPAAETTPLGTIAALPAAEAPAGLPFVEIEAEDAAFAGRAIGPDRTFTSLAAEASGRRAVLLAGPDDHVEFTLPAPANAVIVRAAIPDGPGGEGRDAALAVHVGEERIGTLAVTSRYGWFYGRYPFTNNPSDGAAHHFYDETRLLLGRTLPAGTQIRLSIDQAAPVPWTVVDLADFELVAPPATAPADALSILAFGADPFGARDSSTALAQAIAQARRRGVPVWIPPGTFRIDRQIIVDRVTIAGAGLWHSVLRGNGVGLYGRKAPRGSRRVVLRDFAILGEVKERVDALQRAGVGGSLGEGSELRNLWLQHHKVGVWLDGPLRSLAIRGLRILDNTADGLNLRRGVSDAVVEGNFVRNSGDDGLAAWSHREANHNLAYRDNVVVAPVLANGIAIYGGRDISVTGNVVADSVTQGGGIHLGNRFDAVPLSGTITIADNLIVRGGSFDPNWRFGVGALWLYALDAPIRASIRLRNMRIVDSTLPALQFIGQRIEGVQAENVHITGAAGHALQLQSPGAASFQDVAAVGVRGAGILACGDGFKPIDAGGNSGWTEKAVSPDQALPLAPGLPRDCREQSLGQ
ncbi:mycodextranase [Sphingomonas parva]|uniref:Mycodextranase n=1 Tax=Sphingomonas parva TaxID=2555898 RepID=A0A4Y8ZW98_9SPHN|nr:glycosyl hydrolase family 28-related protein [Sphingomonas parva]TFI58979.1 mycodextranase [Sphingomonas parva]